MTTTNEHKTMASEQDRHNHDVVYKHVVVKGAALPSLSPRLFPAVCSRAPLDLCSRARIAGIQLMSLLAPPLVFTSALLRRRTRPFSLSRSLRTITLSTWLGGSALGVGLAYGRMSSLDDTQVADRAYRIEENKTQRRVDDYSTVGAVLGAVRPRPSYYCCTKTEHGLMCALGMNSSSRLRFSSDAHLSLG